jgi:uncharacterized protein (DUF2384 family)
MNTDEFIIAVTFYKVQDLATELFDGSKDRAIQWINSPTPLLFGSSPRDFILCGEGDKIIEWLKERQGGLPGPK